MSDNTIQARDAASPPSIIDTIHYMGIEIEFRRFDQFGITHTRILDRKFASRLSIPKCLCTSTRVVMRTDDGIDQSFETRTLPLWIALYEIDGKVVSCGWMAQVVALWNNCAA